MSLSRLLIEVIAWTTKLPRILYLELLVEHIETTLVQRTGIVLKNTQSIKSLFIQSPLSMLYDDCRSIILFPPFDRIHEEAEQEHSSKNDNAPVKVIHRDTALARPE